LKPLKQSRHSKKKILIIFFKNLTLGPGANVIKLFMDLIYKFSL
jgi:hypothetical protein